MRLWKTVKAFFFLFALLCLTVMLWSGCAGSKENRPGEAARETGDQGGEDIEVAQPEGESLPPAPRGSGSGEGGSGPGSFDLSSHEIGSKVPLEYLELVDLRWADHGDYFRLVAELRRSDGSSPAEIPWCFTDYPDDPTATRPGLEIRLYIRGIRPEGLTAPGLRPGEGMLTGDPVVYQVLPVVAYTVDGVPAVSIFCSTHEQRPHRLTYATAPARIILDIHK